MKTYDEQTELRQYLWAHFQVICSSAEQRIYKAHMGHLKAAHAPNQDNVLRTMFADWKEPLIANELRDGFDTFTDRVLNRIGADYPELFYVNRCATCNRVLATPKACICGWCGHEWFNRRDHQNQIAEDAFHRVKQHQRDHPES